MIEKERQGASGKLNGKTIYWYSSIDEYCNHHDRYLYSAVKYKDKTYLLMDTNEIIFGYSNGEWMESFQDIFSVSDVFRKGLDPFKEKKVVVVEEKSTDWDMFMDRIINDLRGVE